MLTFSVSIISNAARKANIFSFWFEACWPKYTPVPFYIFNLHNFSRRGKVRCREKTAGRHHRKEEHGGARIRKSQLNSGEKKKKERKKIERLVQSQISIYPTPTALQFTA